MYNSFTSLLEAYGDEGDSFMALFNLAKYSFALVLSAIFGPALFDFIEEGGVRPCRF